MKTNQNKTGTLADLYLRLSDGRREEALDGREARLRAEAARLGWTVHRVVTENDVTEDGELKPASAFKRRKITTPSGKVEYRTVRPGFRSVLADIAAGVSLLAEDLDRVCRDPRDLEDLIDACAASGTSARSLSGSLTFTDGGTDGEVTTARIMVTMANKSSRDTSRRVADARERLAGTSYQGGRRPFGYQVMEGTAKYARNLVVDETEAAAIRKAATDVLDHGVSLKAVAREWRASGMPTVTGVPWSAESVRDCIIKPTVAGKTVKRGEIIDAPWAPVLDVDVWQRLVDKLTDPSRKTGRGNEPRWLASGFSTCGICQAPMKVTGSSTRGQAYVCSASAHLRRVAKPVDEYLEREIIARLSQDDIADLLRPPARQGTDTGALRAESRKLTERKAALGRMFAAGDIDEGTLRAGTRTIKERLAVIDAQLAVSDAPDPLADFRNAPAETVWNSLSVARKREVARLLATVTFLPARRGQKFSDETVLVVMAA
jgi:site-specific DNA recombinase